MHNENMPIDDIWSGHASLHYEDIEQAGEPVRPLDFPTPRVQRASVVSATCAIDHVSGRVVHEVKSILVPTPECPRSSPSEHAYMIKKKLSKTTYGSVRLCVVLRRRDRLETGGLDEVEWESTEEMVALKASSWTKIRQCRGKHLEDPIKEVAALQHVGSYHPHVLGCLEVLQDDDFLYTVMPYCSGGDLYGMTMNNQCTKRPDEQQIRIWFRQLLQGLYHLQKKGVCHRDISLENLVLDENKNLTIVDMGLALRVPYTDNSNYGGVSDVSEGSLRRLMVAQGQSGNLTYLAPEIIERNDAFDGFAVDLWSAGVILFALLVGLAPFRWAHPTDIRFNQISRGYLRELVRSLDIPLSDQACDLLQKMLWRDPSKRLNLAEVMTHPWVVCDGFRTGEPRVPEKAKNVRFSCSVTKEEVHGPLSAIHEHELERPSNYATRLSSF